jgi:branched-chain amino acid aminotransferase
MSNAKGCVYINGSYCSPEEAKLSIFDRGFRGVSVFDVCSLKNGYLLKVDSHINRFFRSMQTGRIKPPLPKDELKEVIFETVRRSGLKEWAYVLMMATPGTPPVGKVGSQAAGLKPTLIVYAIPDKHRPPHLTDEQIFNKGITVRISSIRNVPQQCLDQRIKNFNRYHHYLATMEAYDAGADDVIMLDIYGNVQEPTWANVWIAQDGSILTPTGNILHGIARELVFELAQKEGIKASEATLAPHDLYNADEVFFSSTDGGVLPVIEVDKRRIADGKPGPIYKRLHDMWEQAHEDPQYATLVVK